MATTGKPAWDKYFHGKEVKTKTKSTTAIYDLEGKKIANTIAAQKDITVLGNVNSYQSMKVGASILVTINYKIGSKLHTVRIPFTKIAKPFQQKGATENLGVRAETLITLGRLEKVDLGAKKPVRCRVFYDIMTLQKSVMHGLKNNQKLIRQNESIIDVFEDYFKKKQWGKINWNGDVSPSEINELGKYVGEIIVGVIALGNAGRGFQPNPIRGQVESFIVPDDPSFPGIDSLILMRDGTLLPVSSKYGAGAKASFFPNILPKGLKDYNSLKPCVFKDICTVTKDLNFTVHDLDKKKGAKDIVYEYGMRHILEFDYKKENLSSAMDIYHAIRKSHEYMDDTSIKVIAMIARHKEAPNIVKINLPLSITAFFNRAIAERLNSDTVSINEMKRILSGKNFWQANLNINHWKDGKITYKFFNSGDITLKIIGNKASTKDIGASQGMVNYEMKMP